VPHRTCDTRRTHRSATEAPKLSLGNGPNGPPQKRGLDSALGVSWRSQLEQTTIAPRSTTKPAPKPLPESSTVHVPHPRQPPAEAPIYSSWETRSSGARYRSGRPPCVSQARGQAAASLAEASVIRPMHITLGGRPMRKRTRHRANPPTKPPGDRAAANLSPAGKASTLCTTGGAGRQTRVERPCRAERQPADRGPASLQRPRGLTRWRKVS
jgi:hypothetical protein